MSSEAVPVNSLGLNFEKTDNEVSLEADLPSASPQIVDQFNSEPVLEKETKKPYHNPERVNTGGAQRDKLTEEELAERMSLMRKQNERIKQRRMDVQADEEAFRKTQETERAKLVQNRKIQEDVDNNRKQNARRKMDKIQSREWDTGKPVGNWEGTNGPVSAPQNIVTPRSSSQRGRSVMTSGRGRGRGREKDNREKASSTPDDISNSES